MEISIGKNIKKVRKKRGLTQKELAEKCGLAIITIRQYETEKREPNSTNIFKIADALNVPAIVFVDDKYCDEFFEENNLDYQGNDLAYYMKILKEMKVKEQRLTNTLLTYFDLLDDKGKNKVIDYVKDLSLIQSYRKEDDKQE